MPPKQKSRLSTETRKFSRYHSDSPRWPFKVRGTLIGRQPSSCSDNEEQLRLAYST